MMIFVVAFILLLAVVYLLNASGSGKVIIDKAFAGTPKGGDTVVELNREKNRTIYEENGTVVDLSSMRRFIIDGISLEKVGLEDKTIVYTDKNYDKNDLSSLIGSFIVLKIDNDRTMQEHPDIALRINGFKARKLVAVFPTKMEHNTFMERMRGMLEKDNEVVDVEKCITHLWEKYEFASNYYKDENILLVSITYKNGESKDYSFHSLEYLEGIVRYRNLD